MTLQVVSGRCLSRSLPWAVSLGVWVCCITQAVVKVSANATDNTSGHVWDEDLREMNNPLPMWWVGMFIITVIFGLAYLFLFPGLGTVEGKLGWTEVKQYEAEVAKNNEAIKTTYMQNMHL